MICFTVKISWVFAASPPIEPTNHRKSIEKLPVFCVRQSADNRRLTPTALGARPEIPDLVLAPDGLERIA